MESSISVQSKSLLNWLFDQIIFTINSDVKPSCRTNVLILANWHLKSKTKPIKEIFSPPQGGIPADFVRFHLGGQAHFSYEQIMLLQEFLRKVRSHLGELACLTRPAHLHINSLLENFQKTYKIEWNYSTITSFCFQYWKVSLIWFSFFVSFKLIEL